jgi:MFS family permease
LTHNLPTVYVAAGLFGVGFPLAASTPGIYLIAAWFGKRSSRMIGLYLMTGTLGGAIGPPMAEALIASAGGWRLYWLVMASAGVVTAAVCAVLIKEPPSKAAPGRAADTDGLGSAPEASWTYGEALRTPQFVVLALALVTTQTGLITVSSVASSHFFRLGWPSGAAAEILGAQALVGTVATGISGWLTERVDPRRLHAVGLLAQAAGMLLLAFAQTGWPTYAFIFSFGIGWSVSRVAITILLIRFFGHKSGTAVMSTIWMLCSIAALGPPAAGLVADLTGSFTPALSALGLLLLPLAVAAALMTSPRQRIDRIAPQYP